MDGKHLDHNLGEASRSLTDGGISQRQSESMTGSISLLLGVSTIR